MERVGGVSSTGGLGGGGGKKPFCPSIEPLNPSKFVFAEFFYACSRPLVLVGTSEAITLCLHVVVNVEGSIKYKNREIEQCLHQVQRGFGLVV